MDSIFSRPVGETRRITGFIACYCTIAYRKKDQKMDTAGVVFFLPCWRTETTRRDALLCHVKRLLLDKFLAGYLDNMALVTLGLCCVLDVFMRSYFVLNKMSQLNCDMVLVVQQAVSQNNQRGVLPIHFIHLVGNLLG